MKDRTQRKTAIDNGRRIVQSKNSSKRKASRETTKIRQKNTKEVSLADQIGFEFGNDNDMMSVGKQKLMLRKADKEIKRKEELQKNRMKKEENYDEFEFAETFQRGNSIRPSVTSNIRDNVEELQDFEKLEQEIQNDHQNTLRFNNTGNQEEYFKTRPDGEEISEMIDEQINMETEGNVPYNLKETDSDSDEGYFGSSERNSQFDRTTRLEKFMKKQDSNVQEVDSLIEQMRYTLRGFTIR